MNPTLVTIFGPLRGSTFDLTDAEVSIGREPSNSLPVGDPLLSRKHCVIKKEGEDFKIRDLDSRNGITINGIPAKKRVLQPGDQIQLGDSLFLFQEEAPAALEPDVGIIIQFTTYVRLEDAT